MHFARLLVDPRYAGERVAGREGEPEREERTVRGAASRDGYGKGPVRWTHYPGNI